MSQLFFPFTGLFQEAPLDWERMLQTFPWLQAMDGVPQDAIFHAEGDVLIHTRMVVEAMMSLDSWRSLPDHEQRLLLIAAFLHDVGKPARTIIEENGRVSSRGHARKGEYLLRTLFYTATQGMPHLSFVDREYIAGLVRLHSLPLHFFQNPHPERNLFAASQFIRLDHLALLAEADVRGRICEDQQELLDRVDLFRDFAQEQACYQAPRAFANAKSRFAYFQHDDRDPDYVAYDETQFEVVLLTGLPGAGKDTWARSNLPTLPMIALDEIRQELRISPTDEQGRVVALARERARIFMRQEQSFVWNATNVTHALRNQLITLFENYGAKVRLIYLELPFEQLMRRNHEREKALPEQVIWRLINKLEIPEPMEAHIVEYIIDP